MHRLLHHPRVRRHLRQGVKFAIAGLGGSLIEFSVVSLLVEVIHLDPRIAYLPSGLLSVTFVFLFNKHVTFQNRGDYTRQTLRFALVYGMAFTLNYVLASALYTLGLHYLLAKALAIGFIALLNYTLSHGFIFRKRGVELPL